LKLVQRPTQELENGNRTFFKRKKNNQLIACNSDRDWNETGAALDFVVTRTYYQTPLVG
jgi:hypothetical protein